MGTELTVALNAGAGGRAASGDGGAGTTAASLRAIRINAQFVRTHCAKITRQLDAIGGPALQSPSHSGSQGCWLHPLDSDLHGLCALGDEVGDDVCVQALRTAFRNVALGQFIRLGCVFPAKPIGDST